MSWSLMPFDCCCSGFYTLVELWLRPTNLNHQHEWRSTFGLINMLSTPPIVHRFVREIYTNAMTTSKNVTLFNKSLNERQLSHSLMFSVCSFQKISFKMYNYWTDGNVTRTSLSLDDIFVWYLIVFGIWSLAFARLVLVGSLFVWYIFGPYLIYIWYFFNIFGTFGIYLVHIWYMFGMTFGGCG